MPLTGTDAPPEAQAPRVAVAGLWHLGTVTAACLASRGIPTLAFDPDAAVVSDLAGGRVPVVEPGLDELLRDGLASGTLRVTADPAALADVEIIWIAWDTPIDGDDRADVGAVLERIEALFPWLRDDCLVLVSSQLPVGSIRSLERAYAAARPEGRASFACSPENLRLGRAIDAFTRPDRVIVGVRSTRDADRVQALLAPFDVRIDVVRVESAELAKHALNAFLACSVAFINELARLGEAVGADAREIERALRSDARIGPSAYLRPGPAYAGGTLARDVIYLVERGEAHGFPMPLVRGVRDSNERHRHWAHEALQRLLPGLAGARIAVLGLTYKPGTATLRRSASVELCERLAAAGSTVAAYDPMVDALPPHLSGAIRLAQTAAEALDHASAAVIATEWPEFLTLPPDLFVQTVDHPLVLDAGGFLAAGLGRDPRIRYVTVGVS